MIKQMSIAAALALGLAGPAAAHAMLTAAHPAVGATVATAPTEIELDFSEGIVPQFCGATLQTAAGATVKTGRALRGDGPASLKVPIATSLAAGTYTVKWHAVSVDSHRTQGSFTFTVGR